MTVRVLTALAVAGSLAAAQVPAETSPPAALSVRAAVWGQVARPGLYLLEGSPDLFELLSVAGGPSTGADLNNITLVRERDHTRRRLDLSRIAVSGEPFFLASGDVVIVPESFWSRFNRNLPVISTLAVVANLAVTIMLVAQR
jgi:protein involved in polysaccharide export with SLBB domain